MFNQIDGNNLPLTMHQALGCARWIRQTFPYLKVEVKRGSSGSVEVHAWTHKDGMILYAPIEDFQISLYYILRTPAQAVEMEDALSGLKIGWPGAKTQDVEEVDPE